VPDPGEPEKRVFGGRYVLGRELGRGAMGTVFEARDRRLERDVAVKLLGPDGGDRASLLSEARRTAAVRHPGVVEIFDVIEEGEDGLLVMELLTGETLHARIAREGRLPEQEALAIAALLCDALGAIHAASMIHRDLKPANVFLTKQGDRTEPKLLDFGLAKRSHGVTTSPASDGISGTIEYMAPEQIRGEPLDGRADLYALGVLLYECLAGHLPFVAKGAAQTMYLHLEKAPPEVGGGASAGAEAVVRRLLAKRADDRPRTAEEAKRALALAARSEGRSSATSSVQEVTLEAPEDAAPLELAAAPRSALPRAVDLSHGAPQLLPRAELARADAPNTLAFALASVPPAVSKRVAGYAGFAIFLGVTFFHAGALTLSALALVMVAGIASWAASQSIQRRP
jgi:serine/threonine protein kinase